MSPEKEHYERVGRYLYILQAHRYRIDNIEADCTRAELGVGQFSIAVVQGTAYVGAIRVTAETGERYRVSLSLGIGDRCMVETIEGRVLSSSKGGDALKALLDG